MPAADQRDATQRAASTLRGLLVATCLLGSLGAGAAAHDLRLTDTLLLLRTDGSFQVDLACDLDALALGASPDADSAELAARLSALPPAELEARVAGLESLLGRRVRIRFDGRPVPFRLELPDRRTGPALAAGEPTLLGLAARLSGTIPENARQVTFFASRAFPPVHLTVLDEAALGGRREILERGAQSTPWVLGGDPEARPAGGALSTARTYFSLGLEHIVPRGADHILFVIGLFLLGGGLGEMLWKVTSFTVAHTLTLALATFGLVSLPAVVVEPAIALSIAWIGVENLAPETSGLRRRRLGVFAFGLLHGLGFAGVLAELGLPRGETALALGAFNLGVEAGQILVLAAATVLLAPWVRRSWYRRRLAVPLSLAVAAAGLFWAVERLLRLS